MALTDSTHTLPRLYIKTPLSNGAKILLSLDQTHYLIHVMRAQDGAQIRLFNGIDGEWIGKLHEKPKKRKAATLIIESKRKDQENVPDLMLCAAPIKRTHFDFMIMKATELGVNTIQPVITERTQVRECKLERLKSIAIEAAEQSERLSVPKILEPIPLAKILGTWPEDRSPLLCAEFGEAIPIHTALTTQVHNNKAAIFVGPEGGYTQKEMDYFTKLPNLTPIRLGPRILRADTAVIAALSCWQAFCGDWKDN